MPHLETIELIFNEIREGGVQTCLTKNQVFLRIRKY
jgi:hypothetical protein